MRLLRTVDLTFHEYEGSSIPPYAILSHRWEDEEVTYQEFTGRTEATKEKSGFKKILQCCRQAMDDDIKFFWIDACCIDKSSSAELSEAINSMYAWYQRSRVCYVYLSDVRLEGERVKIYDGHWTTFEPQRVGYAGVIQSKWWTRGWTLQELIAPRTVIFYTNGPNGWSEFGTRSELLNLVTSRTGIPREVLSGEDIRKCSVAERMSWASDRTTTRIEDMAYCLLGIFDVNMPLLYGEGSKAFIRLQVRLL